jgi:protein-L-isoaspartate(D-aspartate) O-methyltransferase
MAGGPGRPDGPAAPGERVPGAPGGPLPGAPGGPVPGAPGGPVAGADGEPVAGAHGEPVAGAHGEPVGDPGGPELARARLVDELRATGRLTSQAVEGAFRAVPRHVFLPEMPASRAYQDEAFVIKTGEDGLPLSSSSQPAIMAIMLEQLGIAPGHRVLEIGTGTGYNAALMRHLVGPEGSVVTVDIDPGLVARARQNLAAAGYPGVIVVCGDGGFGVPDHAPYDRIIVTAGASDLAPEWLAQLAPGGRIALPLSLRGIQLCVALERAGGEWRSRSACRCGFIRMAGWLAVPRSREPLGPQPGLHVLIDDGPAPALDREALWALLNGPFTDVPSGVRVAGLGELGEADLWVTLAESGLARLTIIGSGPLRGEVLPLLPFGALAGPGSAADSGPAVVPGPAAHSGAAPVPHSGAVADSGAVPVPHSGAVADSGAAADSGSARVPGPGIGPGSAGLAVAGLLPAAPSAEGRRDFEVAVRGFGAGSATLAGRLAGRVAAWQASGRPRASDLILAAYPRGTPGEPRLAEPGQVILDRPHTRLVLTWSPPP